MISNAFRQSMTHLHRWAGLLLSAVLFAIFWTGTLSVFDREIDQWMIPELRLERGDHLPLDDILKPRLEELVGAVKNANVELPTERETTLRLMYRGEDGRVVEHYDPVSGDLLALTPSKAASRFIYPFHFRLHLDDLGYWIVGYATMGMLVLLVSGLYVHRKILSELFVFRPEKKIRRATLDLHNLSSLVALPFCIMISFSGLVHSYSTYLPYVVDLPIDGNRRQLTADIYGTANLKPTGIAAPLASIDAIRADAEERWRDRFGHPVRTDYIKFRNLGDEAAVVNMRHINPPRDMASDTVSATYYGASGALLRDFTAAPMRKGEAWVIGFHSIQFDHWPLRWLYFIGGLACCVMIGTGLFFWVESRRKRGGAHQINTRAVLAMTAGSTSGLIIATGAFLIANKLLPPQELVMGMARAEIEINVFFCVWALTFIHAAFRSDAIWRDHALIIAGASLFAVVLNWTVTGAHLPASLASGQWAVAGVDLLLGLTAFAALFVFTKLGKPNAQTALASAE